MGGTGWIMDSDRRICTIHEVVSQKDTFAISTPVLPSLPDIDEALCNAHGSIRRYYVKQAFLNGELSLAEVTELYQQWRDDDEYFLLEADAPCIENIDIGGDSYFYARYPEYYEGAKQIHHVFKFVKMAKRGNDVYKFLVGERFKPLEDLKDIVFFDEDWGVKETRMLFITLTYGQKKCLHCKRHCVRKTFSCPHCGGHRLQIVSPEESWLNIGKEWANFKKNIEKQFGKISCFRTWESTSHSYAHSHAMIIFKEYKFPVFVHVDKEGKKTFRIPDHDKNKISSYWHSNVDIQGVSSTKGAVRELTKYITKDLCSKKGDTTNSMIWLFGKQSYAISHDFMALLCNNLSSVGLKDVQPGDLIKRDMANCHQEGLDWRFVGVFRGKKIGVMGGFWVVSMSKPPPKIIKLIDEERERQNSLKWVSGG